MKLSNLKRGHFIVFRNSNKQIELVPEVPLVDGAAKYIYRPTNYRLNQKILKVSRSVKGETDRIPIRNSFAMRRALESLTYNDRIPSELRSKPFYLRLSDLNASDIEIIDPKIRESCVEMPMKTEIPEIKLGTDRLSFIGYDE